MFYERLKEICKERHTTITALTIKIGLNSSNIGRWKKGGHPSVGVLQQMCKELNCTADYLLGYIDVPERVAPTEKIELSPRERLAAMLSRVPDEEINKVIHYVGLILYRYENEKYPR